MIGTCYYSCHGVQADQGCLWYSSLSHRLTAICNPNPSVRCPSGKTKIQFLHQKSLFIVFEWPRNTKKQQQLMPESADTSQNLEVLQRVKMNKVVKMNKSLSHKNWLSHKNQISGKNQISSKNWISIKAIIWALSCHRMVVWLWWYIRACSAAAVSNGKLLSLEIFCF